MRPEIDLVDLPGQFRRDFDMPVDDHVTEPSRPERLRGRVRGNRPAPTTGGKDGYAAAHREQGEALPYSHSIVAGGFDVTSSTTRFTPGISFTMRAEIVSTRSYGSLAQSAVIASSLVTARITIG